MTMLNFNTSSASFSNAVLARATAEFMFVLLHASSYETFTEKFILNTAEADKDTNFKLQSRTVELHVM